MSQIVDSLFNIIDRGQNGKNIGITMGLPKLESVMDGVQRQTYSIVCGGTGSGKTTFALYAYLYKPLMANLGDLSFRVVYYSLEMTAEILLAKLLSLYIYEMYDIELSYKQIISKQDILSAEHREIIDSCRPWLEQILKQVTIIDRATSADGLYASAHEYAEKHGDFEVVDEETGRQVYTPFRVDETVLIIVDHLGLLKLAKGRKKKEEMDIASNYLMTLRNLCGYSPVVLLQLNRTSSSMDRRNSQLQEIELSDIKDSGGPAEDAEIVMAIFHPHREKVPTHKAYNIKILQDKYRAVQILKNRLGEADKSVSINFFGSIGYWREFDKKGAELNALSEYEWQRYLRLVVDPKANRQELAKENEAKVVFRF